MEKVINPTVKVLTTGSTLIAKQMKGNAGDLLPAHLASLESILLIQEGECSIRMNEEDQVLKQGDAITIPLEVKHQISVIKDLKAVHFMPKDIKFTFFK